MIVDVSACRFLHDRTTHKVNQFELHGVLVHQQVLWCDDPMEDPALMANVSGVNHLLCSRRGFLHGAPRNSTSPCKTTAAP